MLIFASPSLFGTGTHQSGKEGLQGAQAGHDPGDSVQPFANGCEDVRRCVQPHRHAPELTDVFAPENALHACWRK